MCYSALHPLLMTKMLLARAIKMNLANEGLEARKKDEEVASKKRKVEEDKRWEGALPFLLRVDAFLTTLSRQQGTACGQLAVILQGYEEKEES